MDDQDKGFLNDTSLSKTPKSPLKTSTVMKPPGRSSIEARLRQNAAGDETLFSIPPDSTKALNEVTNVSNILPKPQFNFTLESSHNESSLGILQMDNFSDFTDTSMHAMIFSKTPHKEKSKSKKSRSLIYKKNIQSYKENHSLNSTQSSIQSLKGEKECSDSDIEYDGTNIPELNMEYDGLPTSLSANPGNLFENQPSNRVSPSLKITSVIESNNSSVSSEENTRFAKSATSEQTKESENFRESIFKTCEQPSFLDALLSNKSDRKISESWKMLGLDSSKTEAIFQNESIAEKNFLNSLKKFNLLSDSSLKFCADEISARSSSFGSPSTSVDISSNRDTQKSEYLKSVNNEDLGDEMLSGSTLPETFSKPTKLSSTYTKCEGEVLSKSPCKGISNNFDCELNYKNTSVFYPEGENKSFEQFQISDSEFINPGDALQLFEKDEESYKKEHMFEMDTSKESATAESNYSLPLPSDVTAPSWYLEECNTSKFSQRISVGTLISARTENLGKLSQDSKRERPYFGIEATTPIRDRDRTLLSETSDTKTPESSNNSTLRSELSQSLQNSNETEVLRGSTLSRILNDTSSINPLDLALKIIDKCQFKDKASRQAQQSEVSCIKHLSLEDIHEESMNSSNKTSSTLTRSSSMNHLGRVLSRSNKEESVHNSLSVSNVELNNRKMEENAGATHGCVHCPQQTQRVARPPSSCASYAMSVHNSCPSLHGCMNHYGHPQPNAFPMCAFPAHSGCSHGFQYHNPYVQEVLSSFPLQNQQGAVGTYSSMPYAISGVIPVQGPSQLVYPEKIAIGDSQHLNLTVQNCHNRSYFYHVALTSALINNKPVSVEISGVNVPSIVPSNVGNTTDIQVSLSPRYEGTIVVTVQVVACFNPIQPIPNSLQNTLQTKIQYEALRPIVSITHESKNSLDIGTIVAGSTLMKQITVHNKCDASVPLYISLSSDMKNNRILFELNQMKRQTLADPEWQILSQKDILYRLPSAKNGAIGCTLEVPFIIETGTEDSDVSFVLTAAVQSSNQREILDLFRISAAVRVAKLILVDPSQNTLVLQPNSSKQNLRVKNSASINMIYDLAIVGDDTQSFSVSPSSLDLQPMQTTVVSVSFTPCNQVARGSLQASAQPHGKLFSLVDLFGDVQSSINSSEKPAPKITKGSSSRSAEVVQCNRRFLFWKEVDVGSSSSKTFTVKNYSSTTLPFKLYIKEKSRGFKLLTEDNQQTCSLSVELASKEEKEFGVAFSPTSVVSTSVPLYIKAMDAHQKLFTLPLIGYSGSGHLEVKGLTSKQGIGDCLDICAQTETKSSLNSVVVQNTGEREMFLKVVVSLGRAFEISGHVHINPTEFVLLKNETKILFISTSVPDQLSYNENDWGTITLLYGDEILRQQMRRSRNGNSSFLWNNLFEDVNFDVPFEGDDRVSCDFSLHSTSKLQSLFSSSVKKFLIHLNVVRANDISQGSFNALSVIDNTYANLTANSTMMSQRRVTMAASSHSPPVKDFLAIPLNRQSVPMFHSAEPLRFDLSELEKSEISSDKISTSWTVRPDSLIVEANSKDNRVLLINTSSQDLRFKIECEIHVISVSPVSGIIPAKGQIGLRISIIAYSVSKLLEDYQGYIKVFCDNTEKSILIKVPRFSKKPDNWTPEVNVNAAGKSKSLVASAEKTIMSSPVIVQNICNFPQEISLNETALGKTSDTVITVKNLESVSAKWIIQPLSILFTETMDDTLNSESILEISPSSGTLESNAVTNIAINFSPSSLNKYSRFYKLSLTMSNGIKKTCNFKIEGRSVLGTEAFGDLSKSTVIPDKNIKESDHKSMRESKSGIQVESEICEFPATALGKSSVAFLTVKNYSSQNMQISIKNPPPPFYIKISEFTVRKKTFFRLPIAFKPTQSDACEGTLELHSEDGKKIYVKMIGTCN